MILGITWLELYFAVTFSYFIAKVLVGGDD